MEFSEEQQGLICSYVVCWESTTGKLGGWSKIRWFRIP
jgi:hypothetical protein